MFSSGLGRRITALAIIAALVITAAVAWNYHPTLPFLQAVSGPINAEGLSPEPIAPADPDFTGGPPQQPNMGTKPPISVHP